MQTRIDVIGHRGLDPSRPDWFPESSYEAFRGHLSEGYGIEFDPRRTKDGEWVVSHDDNLKRLTNGQVDRNISEMTLDEVRAVRINKCRLATLEEILSAIKYSNCGSTCALHMKHGLQSPENVVSLVEELQPFQRIRDCLVIFDLKPHIARQIQGLDESLRLAASVAHPHDVARYNRAVGGTLLTLDELLGQAYTYPFAWLDEWDLTDEDGTKTFYNQETFEILRKYGIGIGLVTPELHATSPNLLGGESHPDAENLERLFKRIEQIIALQPDAICTDYPNAVWKMIK